MQIKFKPFLFPILLLLECCLLFCFLYDPIYYHSSLTTVLFNLDAEGSIVNFFTGGVLFSITILLLTKNWLSTENYQNINRFMTFSAILFLFLSIDEMTGLHERIGTYLNQLSYFPRFEKRYGEWIILYGIIGVPVFLFSVNPLRFLFKNCRKEFFTGLSGLFLMFSGGVLLEIISYHFPIRTESTAQLYRIEVAIEEGLEMTGAMILQYAVMLLRRHFT